MCRFFVNYLSVSFPGVVFVVSFCSQWHCALCLIILDWRGWARDAQPPLSGSPSSHWRSGLVIVIRITISFSSFFQTNLQYSKNAHTNIRLVLSVLQFGGNLGNIASINHKCHFHQIYIHISLSTHTSGGRYIAKSVAYSWFGTIDSSLKHHF